MKSHGLDSLIESTVSASRRFPLCLILLLSPHCCTAQNTHILADEGDIRWAKASVQEIRIPRLPLKDYALLGKFKALRDVSFYWNGANDAKLSAFSKLTFTNLQEISLIDCPEVTDEGIKVLTNFLSLRGLSLEGTSITDVGLEVIATKMQLGGVNVANCTNITRRGLQAIARCRTIKELSFSADEWTELQVVELINSFEGIKWCEIIDPQSRLNAKILKAKGEAKGIAILVSSAGALQTGRNYRLKRNEK